MWEEEDKEGGSIEDRKRRRETEDPRATLRSPFSLPSPATFGAAARLAPTFGEGKKNYIHAGWLHAATRRWIHSLNLPRRSSFVDLHSSCRRRVSAQVPHTEQVSSAKTRCNARRAHHAKDAAESPARMQLTHPLTYWQALGWQQLDETCDDPCIGRRRP